jgi:predicted DNA-binding protein (MmcQ/YjbR family)
VSGPGAARARLEEMAARLPEAGASGDRHLGCVVRGRTFAWLLDDHHGDGRLAVTVKVAPGRNAALVEEDPERFFMPSYLAARGWVAVALDRGEPDWDLVEDLVRDSYRLVAPKRLARLLDHPAR